MARVARKGHRYPSGKLRPEPADAVVKFKRRRILVEAQLIEPFWESPIAELNCFGHLSDAETAMAEKFMKLYRRYDSINGFKRNVPAISYGDQKGGRSVHSTDLSESDKNVIEQVDKAVKAIYRCASYPACQALIDVAVNERPPFTEERIRMVRSAVRALLRHWDG